jgi:phospholipase/carboxylesterase
VTIDEAPSELGRTLFLPPHEAERAGDLKAMLLQFALPGEERFPPRSLPFIHRFNRPKEPDGTTLVLLHGSGGSEADLMPIARRIAPRSTLLGVRGRATEEGTNRWFRRLDATTFDQADIRSEAEAFGAFVEGALTGYGLDADNLVFLGYSNGANFLAAVIQLYPGLVRRAVLLRGLQVLENPPAVDLSDTNVLVISGRGDPYATQVAELANKLVGSGASVDCREISTGHELTDADVIGTSEWIHRTFLFR